MRPEAHRPVTVIDLSEPSTHSGLFLLTIDPDARFYFELIVRQKHPAEVGNELNSRENIVNFLIWDEKVQVHTGVAKSQQLISIKKCLLIFST